VRLVFELLALACAAAHHLGKENAGFHRTQKDDVFEIGNIDAGGEHVHCDDDAGIGAIAELADALEGTVHVGAASDFADEGIAAAEDLNGEAHELFSMGGVLQVVDGEDEGFREAPGLAFVFQGIGLDLFKDLAVGIG
jgi:hypothetical protein